MGLITRVGEPMTLKQLGLVTWVEAPGYPKRELGGEMLKLVKLVVSGQMILCLVFDLAVWVPRRKSRGNIAIRDFLHIS